MSSWMVPCRFGYLKITEIIGSTPQELRALAEQLEAEGARALVLDLRNVAQAQFHPTVIVADALLDRGTIGLVRERESTRTYRAEPDALFRNWPIVVLVDQVWTPEVAWLCAGLQDNGRATIVGTAHLASPAVVQTTVALPESDWSVEMATGILERGNGQPIGTIRPNPNQIARGMYDLEEKRTIDRRIAQYTATPTQPNPAARLMWLAGADLLKAAPVDPLARAREILAEALKTTAK